MGNLLYTIAGSYDVPDPSTGITIREHFSIVETWSAFRKDMRTSCVSIFLVLFHRYPEYQTVFPAFRNVQGNELPHNHKLLAHALAVAYYLSSMVDSLDDPETLMELIRKNTLNHVRRPVTPQHFDQLAVVILQVMQETLRGRMTATATVAWQKFFKLHNDAVRKIYEEVHKLDAESSQDAKSYDVLKTKMYGMDIKSCQTQKSSQKSPSTSPSGSPKGTRSPRLWRLGQLKKQGPKSQASEKAPEDMKPEQLQKALEHVEKGQAKAEGSSTMEPAKMPSVAKQDKVEQPVKEAAESAGQFTASQDSQKTAQQPTEASSHSTEAPPRVGDVQKADDQKETQQGIEGETPVKVEGAAKAERSVKVGEAPKPQSSHTTEAPLQVAAAGKEADGPPPESKP